jgi:hypothetical protein
VVDEQEDGRLWRTIFDLPGSQCKASVQAPVREGPRRPHEATSGFLCVQSQDKNKLANIPTMQKAMATVDT